MIKLNNLKKYFYKGKPNEIKAVDDITVTLPDSGLVVFLGESGCGKTTLLNTIGGLDKFDGGNIEIDGVNIASYRADTWDKLRNKKIGYIFQNYNLINDVIVYQNIKIALKLAGCSDEKTIETRAKYALSLVGMEKLVSRLPSTLSGGQQQRVGIARAIATGAKIIIADEPTGNLDDKNTMAVMEILKGISAYCLVLLVTHEENLATFYGDRIIRLRDGKIIDDISNSDSTGSLEHRHTDNIYLGDMHKDEINCGDVAVNYFFDDVRHPLKIDVVCKQGKLYLRTSSDADIKINTVFEDGDVKLIEGNYHAKEKNDAPIYVDKEILSPVVGEPKSVFSTFTIIKNSFNRFLAKSGQKKKNPYRVLYIAAVFLVLMFAVSGAAFIFDSEHDRVSDTTMVRVNDVTLAEMQQYEGKATIIKAYDKDASSGTTLALLNGVTKDLLSLSTQVLTLPLSDYDTSVTLKKGEFYLDELMYKRLQDDNSLNNLGIINKEQLINYQISTASYVPNVTVDVEGVDWTDDIDNTTVEPILLKGYLNRGEPCLYLSDEDYAALSYNVKWESYFGFSVPSDSKADKPAFVDLTVSDKKAAVKYLKGLGFDAYDTEKKEFDDFIKAAFASSAVDLIIALAMLVLQLVTVSKISKGNFMDMQRTVTVMRSIGSSKKDIYKYFLFDSAVTVVCSTLRGWAITSIVLFVIEAVLNRSALLSQFNFIHYPVWLALALGAIMFLAAICVALIKPFAFMLKTPAQLNSKYDI